MEAMAIGVVTSTIRRSQTIISNPSPSPSPSPPPPLFSVVCNYSPPHHNPSLSSCSRPRRGSGTSSSSPTAAAAAAVAAEALINPIATVEERAFDPTIPLAEALTPPSSWYTDPSFLSLEYDRVFFRGWQAVGYTEQVQNLHEFFTGRLGSVHFVVCRDGNGGLHAFHNVCRHHASLLASGSGQKTCFVCPYHGWSYGLDGTLLKATRITGIQNFNVNDYGLLPINVATWGPFILINLDKDIPPQQDAANKTLKDEWFGSASELLSSGIESSLKHVCRREYTIECNWKVFCDNYLDGGYHVPYAHKGLAAGLKLDSYSTHIFEKVSIQRCESALEERGDDFDRLGSKALYAFIFPNFMINRYGPWMDTNLVLPLGSHKCQVIFDYFLDPSLKDDNAFIMKSLQESERVQMEDIHLCEGVQKGLESPAYCTGRYAPNVEQAMHHFHCLLHETLATT